MPNPENTVQVATQEGSSPHHREEQERRPGMPQGFGDACEGSVPFTRLST